MKKILILFSITLVTSNLFAQSLKFDEQISCSKPNTTLMKDTTIQGAKLLQFTSNTGSYVYLIIRAKLDLNEDDLKNLPLKKDRLMLVYRNFNTGLIKKTIEGGFILKDTSKVTFKGYTAFEISFKYPQNESMVYNNLALIVNEYAYVFSYINQSATTQNELGKFLESVVINSKK